MPIDVMTWQPDSSGGSDELDYVWSLCERLDDAYDDTIEHLEECCKTKEV